jgi:RNA polymerase sigma-70 factor (ECF subfamily)
MTDRENFSVGAGITSMRRMTNDEILMLRFQAGSRPAFEELFERYRDPLYAFFRRRLAGKERAEDLTQETFAAVIGASARYEPRASFRTYIYSIAFKLLLAERRRQARQAEPSGAPIEAGGTPVETTLWVRRALEELEPGEREILMLREYEQLAYEEIAQLLHLPLNTVRSRLFRARAALRQHLSPEEVWK